MLMHRARRTESTASSIVPGRREERGWRRSVALNPAVAAPHAFRVYTRSLRIRDPAELLEYLLAVRHPAGHLIEWLPWQGAALPLPWTPATPWQRGPPSFSPARTLSPPWGTNCEGENAVTDTPNWYTSAASPCVKRSRAAFCVP